MSVSILKERYEELVRAEAVLDTIVNIVEEEAQDYRVADFVRISVKPYMRPKPPEGGAPRAE